MYDDKYLISFKEELISFDEWISIVKEARKKSDTYKFGLNYKCQIKHYDFATKLQSKIPTLNDHFYILNTSRIARDFPPHVQGTPGAGGAASINWPILNCFEDSPSTWYKCTTEPRFKNDLYKDSYFVDNIEDLVPIHTEAMLSKNRKPCLFRSDIIHKGYNNTARGDTRTIIKWEMSDASWGDACFRLFNLKYID